MISRAMTLQRLKSLLKFGKLLNPLFNSMDVSANRFVHDTEILRR